MAARLAHIRLVDPLTDRHRFLRLSNERAAADRADYPSSAARGILLAVMLSIPIWALIGLILFLLR